MNLGPVDCEKTAQLLMHYASELSCAHQVVRDLCYTAPDAIRAERDALDAMDDHAKSLSVAMRSIAMRLDRAAMCKFNPERGAA